MEITLCVLIVFNWLKVELLRIEICSLSCKVLFDIVLVGPVFCLLNVEGETHDKDHVNNLVTLMKSFSKEFHSLGRYCV